MEDINLRHKMVEKYRNDHFDNIFDLFEDLKECCVRNGVGMLSEYNAFNNLFELIEKNTKIVDNMMIQNREINHLETDEYDDIEEMEYWKK